LIYGSNGNNRRRGFWMFVQHGMMPLTAKATGHWRRAVVCLMVV